eukprot:Pgem_evm1s17898
MKVSFKNMNDWESNKKYNVKTTRRWVSYIVYILTTACFLLLWTSRSFISNVQIMNTWSEEIPGEEFKFDPLFDEDRVSQPQKRDFPKINLYKSKTEFLELKFLEDYDVLVVGAGLSGMVFGELLARFFNKKVLIIDKRNHIGGNLYDFEKNGILRSAYGSHLFHTNFEHVWKYLNRFVSFVEYHHRVLGYVDDKYIPIPINIDSVNTIYGTNINTTEGMTEFMEKIVLQKEKAENGEEAARKRVGDLFYQKIFKEYTHKQWNRDPSELDAAVLERIPVSHTWDDRYFPNDKFQGLPKGGYSEIFKNALGHRNIDVLINTECFDLLNTANVNFEQFEKVIFTGPIDQFFVETKKMKNSKYKELLDSDDTLEPLQYRSINFEVKEIPLKSEFFLPAVKLILLIIGISVLLKSAGVVNYPQERYGRSTRCIDYKHFYNQRAPHTVVMCETSTDVGEPYYPVPDDRNKNMYKRYQSLAQEIEKQDNVIFVGRLANYKYF